MYNEEITGHNIDEVICMNRFKWPFKFSSILKSVKEKLKLLGSMKFVKRIKKMPKIVPFAVFIFVFLIGVNSFFWWYRATHGGFQFGGQTSEKPTQEWDINMNEQVIDEQEVREQYILSEESQKQEKQYQDHETPEQEPEEEKDKKPEPTETVSEAEIKTAETAVVPTMATMAMPTLGKVITTFAMDTLVYSKTLEQWNTHNGIDIAADLGSPIKAAMDGTVVEVISNDPKLGVVVVIDHGGGIKTLYANLQSDNLVKKGDLIKKGQIIGAVGKTAPYEIEDPPHLHFEVLKDGKNIDPQQYLPKIG